MKKTNVARSLFVVDATAKTISASKAAMHRAANPNSKEYKELNKLQKQHPDFAVVEKDASKKTTYEGMNYPFMKAYIRIQKDSEELMEEFESVKLLSGDSYPLVKKWFLDTFKDEDGKFDMRKANREITHAKIDSAKVMVKKVQKSPAMVMPKVVNE